MKRLLATLSAIYVAALGTAGGSESYTYGDAISGEEVSITKESLDSEIARRIRDGELQYQLGLLAQVLGDGILCDLLLTRETMRQNPNISLRIAAENGQLICTFGGIQLQNSLPQQ